MTDPTVDLEALSFARRVAVAQLVRDWLATARDLAALYAGFEARSTVAPLRAGLAELARAKAAHVAALEPLARALDALVPSDRPGGPGDRSAPPPRGSEFARAFEGERALEVDCRELAGLLGTSARLPLLPRLAAESAEHRAWLRRLYLRYS